MNREFLRRWQRRRLGVGLLEASAEWDLERALPRYSKVVVSQPRVQTNEEHRIIIVCITTTLRSLFQHFPYCLAVVHTDSLAYLDESSRGVIQVAPQSACPVYWAPGERDFIVGDSPGSLIAELNAETVGSVALFFKGRDPACALLFSQRMISPESFAAKLARQKSNKAALRVAVGPQAVLAHPALDGDVVAFVASDRSLIPLVAGDDAKHR